jgi:hypothetical protein
MNKNTSQFLRALKRLMQIHGVEITGDVFKGQEPGDEAVFLPVVDMVKNVGKQVV